MSRVAVVSLLVSTLCGLLLLGSRASGAVGQAATPGAGGDLLVGTWIVQELAPPAGGPPVTAGVLTLFADGNALLSGFGGDQPAMQGAWTAAADGTVTLTVAGLIVDQSGLSDGTLQTIRAVLDTNAAGDALEGGYTFNMIDPAGEVQFTYHGPLGGTRVTAAAPDPIALTLFPATPVVGTPAS